MSNMEIFGLSVLVIMLLGILVIPATAAYSFWKLEHKHPVAKP